MKVSSRSIEQRSSCPKKGLCQVSYFHLQTSRQKLSRDLQRNQGNESMVKRMRDCPAGYLAAISDYILDNSQLPVLLGAVTSVALLGYHISTRAESLTEISSLPLLSFRSSYTPQAVYELFEALGPEGEFYILLPADLESLAIDSALKSQRNLTERRIVLWLLGMICKCRVNAVAFYSMILYMIRRCLLYQEAHADKLMKYWKSGCSTHQPSGIMIDQRTTHNAQ